MGARRFNIMFIDYKINVFPPRSFDRHLFFPFKNSKIDSRNHPYPGTDVYIRATDDWPGC